MPNGSSTAGSATDNPTPGSTVVRVLEGFPDGESIMDISGRETELRCGDLVTVSNQVAQVGISKGYFSYVMPVSLPVVEEHPSNIILPYCPPESKDDFEKAVEQSETAKLNRKLIAERVRRGVPKKKNKQSGEVEEWEWVIDRQKMALYLTDKFCTISTGGEVWLYEDGAYHRDNGEIHALVTMVARELDQQKVINDDREVTAMLLGTNHFPEPPFNYKIGYLPFKNGYIIIDFDNGEITGPFSHSPENMFTYVFPVEYDKDASITEVLKVLGQWVDEDEIPLLIQIPAQGIIQAMIDDTFKKSYLIQGERDSGKSSYLELLYRAFGKDSGALSLVSLHNIVNNRFSIASLENVVLNVYDELESEELQGFGTFKKLTGGTLHEIERKNRDPRNARIFCTHVFACNIPPMVPERVKYDLAFWSRWEFIRFPFTHERNPTWHDRTFTPEFLSGYFNLVIQAMMRIYKHKKLVVNRTEEEVMEKWFQNSDPLYQFIDENTNEPELNGRGTPHPQKYDKGLLFKEYLSFCKEMNFDQRRVIQTLEKFTREIQKYGFLPRKERISILEGGKKRSGLVWCFVSYKVWNGGMKQVEPSLGRLDDD